MVQTSPSGNARKRRKKGGVAECPNKENLQERRAGEGKPKNAERVRTTEIGGEAQGKGPRSNAQIRKIRRETDGKIQELSENVHGGDRK